MDQVIIERESDVSALIRFMAIFAIVHLLFKLWRRSKLAFFLLVGGGFVIGVVALVFALGAIATWWNALPAN